MTAILLDNYRLTHLLGIEADTVALAANLVEVLLVLGILRLIIGVFPRLLGLHSLGNFILDVIEDKTASQLMTFCFALAGLVPHVNHNCYKME